MKHKPEYPSTWNDDGPLPPSVAVQIYTRDAQNQSVFIMAAILGAKAIMYLPVIFPLKVIRFLAGRIALFRHQ